MRFKLATLLAVLSFAVLWPLPSRAQTTEPTYPALDLHRLSIAAGANYDFFSATGDQAPPDFAKEWRFGAYGAYVLGRNASLIASENYLLDNKWWQTEVGIRVLVFNGAKWNPPAKAQ